MSWKSLLWSAAAIVLMLSLLTSPINMVTTLLVMTPFVVLYTMLKPGVFIAHLVPIALAAFLLSGPYGAVIVTLGLFFLVPAIAMGHLYKKMWPAQRIVLIGAAVILVQLLLELVLFSWLFDIEFKTELAEMLTSSFLPLETSGVVESGWAAESAAAFSNALIVMLPMLLLVASFLFAVVTHYLSRKALRTVGIEAPRMREAKEWRMPRSLVMYYLIALIASLIVPSEDGGYWTVVIANLIPILQFLFVIQSIGFLFFVADVKRWSRALPIVLSIPFVLFPQPLFLLGLLDIAFPLRRYFVKSE